MQDVVIDLGELPHEPQRRVRPASFRSPRPFRPLLTAFAVALTTMMTSAVRPPAVPVPASIPARLGDTLFSARDRFFVVTAPDEGTTGQVQNRIISVYALPTPTLLSRTPVTTIGPIMKVAAIDDILLVSQQVEMVGGQVTTALVAGSGRVLWQHPARLISASPSGRLALLLDSGAGARRGPLRWYGVEPATGVALWSQEAPISGSTDLVYGVGDTPSRLVSATVDGELQVRDAETGQVTASAVVPVPAEWRIHGLNIWIAGDLMLLGGRSGITAYDLADLHARWSSRVDLMEAFVLPACGDAICLFGRFGGLQVIDPGTGRPRWGAERWAVAQRVGPYLLTAGRERPNVRQSLIVVDPASGHERGSFGTWRPIGEPLPDGRIIGVRERLSESRVWYAVLEPRTLTVRLLGVAEPVTGGCQVITVVLVCRRLDSSVGVWPLSTK